MSETQWNIPAGGPVVPPELLEAGCSPLLAAVLHARGLDAAFLDVGSETLADPLLLPDMAAAVERLRRAIEEKEHVAVYGDYDVDGITSSCMLTDYLRGSGVECELYIPNRIGEGYGVNAPAIRALWERGVRLIVTVDCGVTTVEETAYAASLGVDMIVTDHHECRETLPPALAVVDPKRPDCVYPGGELSGVGVAFKLLCALTGDADAMLERYADLVAVGTIADVMPLVGENRYIVKRGLEKLERSPRPGFRALIEEAGMGEKKITATGVGFTLAPRLNASGRLGRVESAAALLLTGAPQEAEARAAELCQLNRDRQALETEIWLAAQEMLGERPVDAPIVLAGEGWHQGVIGIVASRLTEVYGVPTVMICLDGEHGKGSCRSYGGFNLFEALNACAEHLEGFGGHALAAGLTVRRDCIPAFRAAFAEYYRSQSAPEVPTLDVDLRIDDPLLLSMDCVEDLTERLEPCGTGNPRPLLCMTGVKLAEVTPLGGGRHLRLRLERYGQEYDGVWFSHTQEELLPQLRAGDWADAVFCPQINLFRGSKSVQLLLAGLRRHDDSAAEQILDGNLESTAGLRPPVREEFALVWRALTARGGRCCESVPGLVEALSPRMSEETLCVILKVFAEVGLLTLAPIEAGHYELRVVPGVKADLETSPLLRRLREQYEVR